MAPRIRIVITFDGHRLPDDRSSNVKASPATGLAPPGHGQSPSFLPGQLSLPAPTRPTLAGGTPEPLTSIPASPLQHHGTTTATEGTPDVREEPVSISSGALMLCRQDALENRKWTIRGAFGSLRPRKVPWDPCRHINRDRSLSPSAQDDDHLGETKYAVHMMSNPLNDFY